MDKPTHNLSSPGHESLRPHTIGWTYQSSQNEYEWMGQKNVLETEAFEVM